MPDVARLCALIEKVADAREPSRELFADVWFATTGKQHPDIKVRFAQFMEARAWTDAALITAAYALTGWGVITRSGPGPGEARVQPPGAKHRGGAAHLVSVRHAGGAALAILQALMLVKAAAAEADR